VLMSGISDAEIAMAEARPSGIRQERRNLVSRVRFPWQCFARLNCSLLLRGAGLCAAVGTSALAGQVQSVRELARGSASESKCRVTARIL
jgi:hypothetical protein